MTAVTNGNGNRRRVTTMEAVSIAMLLIQFGILVWGASALKSSTDQNTAAVRELTDASEKTEVVINALSIDVGILKDRTAKK